MPFHKCLTKYFIGWIRVSKPAGRFHQTTPNSLCRTPNFWGSFYWCKTSAQGAKDRHSEQNCLGNWPQITFLVWNKKTNLYLFFYLIWCIKMFIYLFIWTRTWQIFGFYRCRECTNKSRKCECKALKICYMSTNPWWLNNTIIKCVENLPALVLPDSV